MRLRLMGLPLLGAVIFSSVPMAAVIAHGDEPHADPAAHPTLPGAAAASARELVLPKPLQRALAITTTRLDALPLASAQRLLAEVVINPDARARLQAPEPGRLRAAGAAWPVAGRRVRRGELLAILEPVLSQREQAQRRIELAGLEQRQRIASINVDRLQLQSQAAGGLDAAGNTYLEQAVQEAATLKRQLELLHQSLDGRVDIRAGEDGLIQRVPVSNGEVVSRGQNLFEMAGSSRPLLAVRSFDADSIRPGTQARAHLADGVYTLRLAGHAAAAPEPGWNLWLEFADAAPSLPVGAPVPIDIVSSVAADPTLRLLPLASLQGSAQQAHVWLHVAAERFQRRPVQVIATRGDSVLARLALSDEARLVVSGASLLDQYP